MRRNFYAIEFVDLSSGYHPEECTIHGKNMPYQSDQENPS